MFTQSFPRKTILLLSLISLLLVGAFAQDGKKPAKPAKVDCSAMTDADIVKAVQDKIKADPKFKDQLKQINVSSKDGKVTLDGWVKGAAAKTAVGKHAKSVKCVKAVANNLGTRLVVGCGRGQKQCGDICIDSKAECNIMN
ncbi:MAG: BON domain-containing protein [Acidobacteria bacterium]|nr:BON domain-containing protein [Acidobacteriota bacterium]